MSCRYCLAILPLLLAASPLFSAESHPNIVMIIGDDQAWTDFGFMGHPVVKTPNLDELASQSALFPNGYVPTSLCRPSLATMISGLFPHQHKITGNDPPKGVRRSKMLRHIRRIPKIPALLGKKGYVSFQTGKWWEGNFREGGFTAGMTHGDPSRGGRHGDKGLAIGRKGLQPIWNFLEENEGKPFFLWYAPMMPHRPHNPPQRFLEKYLASDRPKDVARYYAMCTWFDETCGRLLDGLAERGLVENTLVIYVTDNGWIERTKQMEVPEGWHHAFAPKSKRSPYDGGVRTPIMLHWPGHIESARYETLVSSIDIAPTVLSVVGIEPSESMHGLNLIDIAAASGKCDRNTVFGEIYHHDVTEIDNPAAGLRYRWCRQGDWKIILSTNPRQRPELYNLAKDPDETNDLAREFPERVTRLRAELDRWWTPRADEKVSTGTKRQRSTKKSP